MSNILLKFSNGREGCYLFYSPKQGLCSRHIQDGALDAKEILIDGITAEFDAVIDNQDTIHIVCQDKSKNIIYIKQNGKNSQRRVILKAREGADVSAAQFRIFIKSGHPSIIYIMKHKGENLLCTHDLYAEGSVPQVIGIIGGHPLYAIAQNSQSDTIVCYCSKETQRLVTQRYIWSQKRWEDFEEIDSQSYSPVDLQLYSAADDTLYLCGRSHGALFVRQKKFDFESSVWSAEQVISRRQSDFPTHPAIFEAQGKLLLCQCIGNSLTAAVADKSSGKWERLREISDLRHENATMFLLSSADISLSVPHYGFISGSKINLLGGLNYFAAQPHQNVNIGGVQIPIKSVSPAGSDVERFAMQNSYSDNFLPSNKEEIEREKQRILKMLTEQDKAENEPQVPSPAAHTANTEPLHTTALTRDISNSISQLAAALESIANTIQAKSQPAIIYRYKQPQSRRLAILHNKTK